MLLSIIVPVYNEEKTVDELIRSVLNVNYGIDFEILIINDGSTDGTSIKLETIKKEKVKIINHEKNQGKGTAIRTGFKYARGDICIIQDADLEYDPNQIPKVIGPILKGQADVVYGSRYLECVNADVNKQIFHHYWGNIILTAITNLLYSSKITDVETCYKAFSKDVISSLNLSGRRFEIEPEITTKLLRSGIKIMEVPIIVKPRSFKEGKKISWIDGIIALYYILKFRLFD